MTIFITSNSFGRYIIIIINAVYLLALIGLLPAGIYFKFRLEELNYGRCCLPAQCNLTSLPNTFFKNRNNGNGNICVLSIEDMDAMQCPDIQNCKLNQTDMCVNNAWAFFYTANGAAILTIIVGIIAIICAILTFECFYTNSMNRLRSGAGVFYFILILLLGITVIFDMDMLSMLISNSVEYGTATECITTTNKYQGTTTTCYNNAVFSSIYNNCSYSNTTATYVNWFVMDYLTEPIYYSSIVTCIVFGTAMCGFMFSCCKYYNCCDCCDCCDCGKSCNPRHEEVV